MCHYDFSFRNLNPNNVALRVKKKLTQFIQHDYFNEQMLCDLRIAELEKEREKVKRPPVSHVDDLLLIRAEHVCQLRTGNRTFA